MGSSLETVSGGADHRRQIDRVRDVARKVLIVVANPTVSSNNGWPVGFWAAELTHPYYELTEAGFEVTIASPAGGKVGRAQCGCVKVMRSPWASKSPSAATRATPPSRTSTYRSWTPSISWRPAMYR
jgi:hypothetical protein